MTKYCTKSNYILSQRSLGEPYLNLSKNSQRYILNKKHNKSIFFLTKDELIFRNVFSELIERVALNQLLSKSDILERVKDVRFSEVLQRLNNEYSEDTYPKIISKVRTVGISKRAYVD